MGVLKADKNKVYSGIDNSMLGGMLKPWVFAYYTTTTFEPANVIITYENGQGKVQTQTITPWTDGAQGAGIITGMIKNDGSGGPSGTVATDVTNILPSGLGGSAHTIVLATSPWVKVKRVLKVQLKSNLKGTADKGLANYSDRVYIKVFDRATALTGHPENANRGAATSETMAMVSLGNPIVEDEDFMSSINLDGSESRTRASNRIISNYFFDEDKLTNSGTTWLITAPNNGATQTGEIFSKDATTGVTTAGYSSERLR